MPDAPASSPGITATLTVSEPALASCLAFVAEAGRWREELIKHAVPIAASFLDKLRDDAREAREAADRFRREARREREREVELDETDGADE